MNTLLLQMEGHQLLNSEQVQRLRQYISQKYSNCDASITAQIFAQAVHSVLERYLLCLEDYELSTVKTAILSQVIKRNSFYITGYDLFKGVLSYYKKSQDGINAVKKWLFNYCETIDKQLCHISIPWTYTSESAIREFDDYLDTATVGNEDAIWTFTWNEDDESPEIDALSNSSQHDKSYDNSNSYLDGEWLIVKDAALPLSFKRALLSKVIAPVSATFAAGILMLSLNVTTIETNALMQQTLNSSDTVNVTVDNSSTRQLYGIAPETQLEQLKNQSLKWLKELNAPEPPAQLSSVKSSREQIGYRVINSDALKAWLKNRGSLLSKGSHLQVIMAKAKAYNLDPILLIAITGQEQSFVQSSSSNAHLMINNPFNVHGSWRKYNTTLEDSADIACKTLLRLVKNCPDHMDPIKWINRKYAQDASWWLGVKQLIKQIEAHPGVIN